MPRPPLKEANYALVRRGGRRKWYVTWTEGRRSRYRSTGCEDSDPGAPSKPGPEARQWLEQFKATVAVPQQTVADLVDAYLAARADRLTHKTMCYQAGHVKAHLGALAPHRIAAAIPRYHEQRGLKMTAIRRELELLRSALLYAEGQGWIERAPKIDMPYKRPPRDRYMTRAQGRALLAGAGAEHVKLFIWVGLVTGQRKGAILDLTWDRVDLKGRVLDFRNPDRPITKKRRGVVPIAKDLAAALREAKIDARTDHVIEWRGARVRDNREGFYAARKAAGLGWVTPHMMKHSVVSWLAEDGYTLDRIADLTSTDPDTVRRIYRKVNPESLREMADSLAEGLVNPTGGRNNPSKGVAGGCT